MDIELDNTMSQREFYPDFWKLNIQCMMNLPKVNEMGHHEIDKDGIAKSLLPYIKSLNEIYSRIYTNKSSNIK